jgi:DNA-binding NtrC family response regulator
MRTSHPRAGSTAAAAKPRANRRKLVLIVEDDRAKRGRIARALAQHAPRTDFAMAQTGDDFRHAVAFHRPDAVIVSTPAERAAAEAAMRRLLPGDPNRLVFAAAADPEVQAAARKAGAAEVLARLDTPEDYAALAQAVRRALGG